MRTPTELSHFDQSAIRPQRRLFLTTKIVTYCTGKIYRIQTGQQREFWGTEGSKVFPYSSPFGFLFKFIELPPYRYFRLSRHLSEMMNRIAKGA